MISSSTCVSASAAKPDSDSGTSLKERLAISTNSAIDMPALALAVRADAYSSTSEYSTRPTAPMVPALARLW